MGTIKDTYDILKDLLTEAKKLQNQEMIALALEAQEKIFELRDELEKMKDKNKGLIDKLNSYEHPQISENDIKYSPNGFLTLKSEYNKLPYCSYCRKTKRKLIPLSRHDSWWRYKCANCQSQIVVMTEDGNEVK